MSKSEDLPDPGTTTAVRTRRKRMSHDQWKTPRILHGKGFVEVHVTDISTTGRWVRKANLGIEIGTLRQI